MKFTRCGVALSLLVVSAVVLSGCSGDSGNSTSSSGSSTPVVPVNCGGKKKILAAGSTAQKNAMEQFVYAFIHACPGHTLDYNANGSGAGMASFIGGQTDLAGSDSPMNAEKGEPDRARERCGSPAWDLPVVFGPIAVTYNISGINSLSLDGPTVAKIFNGTITKWDDPGVKALNPNVPLPATQIHVVFRGDKSGTTDNFQRYLDAASNGAWGKGTGQVFNGGVGEGANGNDGTSQAMKKTDGSITYNEWSFAEGHQLNKAQIITSAGPQPVSISPETVGKTIAGAKFKPGSDERDLIVDTSSFYLPTQSGAYPIVLVTYEIVCSKYPDTPTGQAVKAFMQATIGDGQVGLDEYGYIPLPESFRSKLIPVVNAIA